MTTAAVDLYAASLTATPILLLTALAQTQVFGPLPRIRRTARRRREDRRHRALDLMAVALAAASFFVSLGVLAGGIPEGPFTRTVVAGGLGLAALGLFLHVGVSVRMLYEPPGEDVDC